MKQILSLVFCLLLGFGTTAQMVSAEIRSKIDRANTLNFPASDIDTSSFTYYRLADNYNKSGDSVQAGNYLQKINPYYLMYISPTPAQLEEQLSKFMVTSDVKEKVSRSYQQAYATAKQPSYDSFKHFYLNIRYLSSMLYSGKKEDLNINRQKLRTYDSLGTAYLRRYIGEHGWPALVGGSMYAAFIAQRDIEHYYDYLLAMEPAFYKGDVSFYMLGKVKENRYYYTDYMMVKHAVKGRHLMLPMNMLLYGELPSPEFKDSVMRLIKQMCPVNDLYYVWYTKTARTELKDKMWHDIRGDDFVKSMLTFHDNIEDTCPNAKHGVIILTRVLPTDKKEDELYLVIY